MAPIIIIPENTFIDDQGNEHVTFLKADFQKYIEQAYDGGYEDGKLYEITYKQHVR